MDFVQSIFTAVLNNNYRLVYTVSFQHTRICSKSKVNTGSDCKICSYLIIKKLQCSHWHFHRCLYSQPWTIYYETLVSRSSYLRCSVKKIFQKYRKFYRKTQTQVLSCEYCEVFKNTYFEEQLRTAASEYLLLTLRIYTEEYLGPCQISIMKFFLRK